MLKSAISCNGDLPVKLPDSVQEIADAIGRNAALYLVGQLPRCYSGKPGHKSNRVILYVPKTLKPDHRLVTILGWPTACRLVSAFGGEILQPGNCREIYGRYRDASILRMIAEGDRPADVAALMGVSERHVRNLTREKPQEETPAANDNNPPSL